MKDDETSYEDLSQDEKNLAQLQDLRSQHRHLDSEILALQSTGVTDMLKIARMKKLKLLLKDNIRAIEDTLTPDIIA